MKRNNSRLALILFALLMFMLVSCVNQDTAPPSNEAKADSQPVVEKETGPAQLPVRFQNPSYYIQESQTSDDLGDDGTYCNRAYRKGYLCTISMAALNLYADNDGELFARDFSLVHGHGSCRTGCCFPAVMVVGLYLVSVYISADIDQTKG